MTLFAVIGGWLAAVIAVGTAATIRWGADTRMEMVAQACHELRGPLAAARLGLSFGSSAGELTPDRLRAIDAELGRASCALDDLADLRRRTRRPRRCEPIDLAALVRDSIEAWQGTAAAAGRSLTGGWSGDGTVVLGDGRRLVQAVGNLIANALEHGDGPVVVSGTAQGARARIEVTDGGTGLPAPVAELIGRARDGRGARGRGLAIAVAAARAHRGCLEARPRAGGTTLVLKLPACHDR
jgi:signal transduction histidine kinase